MLDNNYSGLTKLKDWWGKVKANFTYLDNRISTIITTPVDGVSAQEIIDARKGELALGDKIDAMDLEVSTHLADYVRQPGYANTSGTAPAYIITLNPAPTAYVQGMCIAIKFHADNTGAATINVNGLGEKSLRDSLGSNFTPGMLKATIVYTFRYNGGAFVLQGGGTEVWIAPTLLNSWVNYGGTFATAGYCKDSLGFVHLKGHVKSGVTTINTKIFDLPNGYRPANNEAFTVFSNDGAIIGSVSIDTSGQVFFVSGGNNSFSLSNIIFKAA